MGGLLWFIIGAGAATWWTKHKSSRYNCPGSRRNQSPPFSQPHPFNNTAAKGDIEHLRGAPEVSPAPENQQGWKDEKDRIKDISRQAGDTVAEISEATLETLLTTVETLKTKLADHRAERGQEEGTSEEQTKQPPRYV